MNTFTVGFIGLGLIGGSIAKAIRYAMPSAYLIAHTRSSNTMEYAVKNQIIDEACDQVDHRFGSCDFIFLCAPVESNASYLKILKPLLKESCILTDVGSTKMDIHQKITELEMEEFFIGGHPMAGSEKTGIENSKRILLENPYYMMTPTSKVSEDKIKRYYDLVLSLKALPLILSYEKHDFATAAISHLPHIIASSLVNLVKDSDFPDGVMKQIAAGGFKDITRIASSSPEMWEQICSTNSTNIIRILDDYIKNLQMTKAALTDHSNDFIHKLFADAREYRDSISDTSRGPIPKSYSLYCDMVDEAGGIAALATILATNGISIKNIGIVHNREFEEAVLHVEFYEDLALKKAAELLRRYRYTIYER